MVGLKRGPLGSGWFFLGVPRLTAYGRGGTLGDGSPCEKLMHDDFNSDHGPLQTLLTGAFAVSESGSDAERLAALVEIQRLIDERDLSLDGVMHLIAEQVRQVADASGSAIGQLKAGQLMYTGGTGSAAKFLDRRVTATLSGPAQEAGTAEILRVENADADTRIQSEICRQFGAKSLLILSIYCERTLSGVLQVFFSEAHQFTDQELHTYRMLAEFVGDVMSLSSRPKPKAALATTFSERNPISEHKPPLAQTIRRRAEPSATWMRWVGLPMVRRTWDLGIAAAVLMACVSLVLSGDRSATTLQLPSSPSGISNSAERQNPAAPTQPVADHLDSNDFLAGNAMHHSVRSSPKWSTRSASQVVHFGDDVTVRYFAPTSAVMQTNVSETEVRRISDDVSVRHFKQKNVATPSHY